MSTKETNFPDSEATKLLQQFVIYHYYHIFLKLHMQDQSVKLFLKHQKCICSIFATYMKMNSHCRSTLTCRENGI